ncbi:MAG: radical SAM protein [Proteobacteria bacterium]|nr:radical SAM protein [Pseudomonadota bacterium]MBU1708846.1 radical SAM protein [Pseudomonadota bacterium]
MNRPQPKTVGFKPNERNIFFHLLTACNLSCKHCYINPDQHGTNMVSCQTMEEWLALFAHPTRETNIIFLGGEPTLHPDLAHGIQTARKLGYASITVDSNGFLFHDFLEKVAPEDLDFLSFSLDGPTPGINDPIRGRDVFKTCTENIIRAVKKNFNVSLIYTVSRMNIHHLHRMPDLLDGLGVKRFFIQVIGLRGKSAQSPGDLQLTPEEWRGIIPEVAAKAAEKGIHVTFPKVFLDKDEAFACAGNVAENFFIFPNGRVYLCPLCEDYPVNAYRIEDNQLLDNDGITEKHFFSLNIPEGCVLNKMLQPGNLVYDKHGTPLSRISCCLLKQEISPS